MQTQFNFFSVMKVCVIGLRGFPEIQGGVEKHCEALYTHCNRDGVEFVVFRRKPYIKVKESSHNNILFIDLPSTTIKGAEAVLHSFLSTVRSLFCNPDVVHIHNIGPALFCPLLKLFGKKVVVTYHSPNYEHAKWGLFARNILRFSEWITFHFSDHIIFVNKFQMAKMPAKYRHKASYIPNGIADELKVTDACDRIEQFGLESGKYILALGRITPEKGFDLLAKAFSKTKDTGVKLCIAGGVETEKAYFESIKKSVSEDRAVFPGFVTGELTRQLYSNARLYVLSSRNEGFPLVLLDAMAYKRDILASDIPATHLVDLPQEDYYQTSDIDELAKKIEEKLSTPYKTVEYDMTPYNWSNIADNVMDIYYKLVDENRG